MSYGTQVSGIVDHAFLQNLFEHGRGNGFLTGGVVTSDGTDLDSDFTAFDAVVNGTWVHVAASKVTHDAGDATNPRMDAIAVNSSGTVSIVKGTATAESTSQTRPPLNALTAGLLIVSVLYVPSGASVALDANQFDRRLMIDVGFEGPISPQPPGITSNTTTQYATNTTANVSLVELNRIIHATKWSMEATTVGTSGVFDFGLFSNDGQTRLINDFTGTISGTGLDTTTLATATSLPPGLYYVMTVPTSTADITFRSHTLVGVNALAAPSGENEASGTVTVSAGTIPTTFNPDTDVTFAAAGAPQVRLD